MGGARLGGSSTSVRLSEDPVKTIFGEEDAGKGSGRGETMLW